MLIDGINCDYIIGDKWYKNHNKHTFYPYNLDENGCFEVSIRPHNESGDLAVIKLSNGEIIEGEFEIISEHNYKKFETKIKAEKDLHIKIEYKWKPATT